MEDKTRWASAWARFEAFRDHLPGLIDQDVVDEYHSILNDLRATSGEFLNEFVIPPSEMKPNVASFRFATRRLPGNVSHMKEKYCDEEFFKRKVEGLWRYMKSIEQPSTPPNDKDYWSLTDSELERLARKYNIPPWSRAGEQGEHWYVDRTRIIDELVKRDNALKCRPATTTASKRYSCRADARYHSTRIAGLYCYHELPAE